MLLESMGGSRKRKHCRPKSSNRRLIIRLIYMLHKYKYKCQAGIYTRPMMSSPIMNAPIMEKRTKAQLLESMGGSRKRKHCRPNSSNRRLIIRLIYMTYIRISISISISNDSNNHISISNDSNNHISISISNDIR